MKQYEIDVLGEVCPIPLMKTQKMMAEINCGEQLVIHTDFTRSVRNIMDLSRRMGYPIEVAEAGRGVWKIILTKN